MCVSRNSWCDPFKTWQKVFLPLIYPFHVCILTSNPVIHLQPPSKHLRVPTTLSDGRYVIQILLFFASPQNSSHPKHRPTTSLDRTVRTREPRLNRLAPRSVLRRGLLDGRDVARRLAAERVLCTPAAARLQVQDGAEGCSGDTSAAALVCLAPGFVWPQLLSGIFPTERRDSTVQSWVYKYIIQEKPHACPVVMSSPTRVPGESKKSTYNSPE